jgi:hypothetical protein
MKMLSFFKKHYLFTTFLILILLSAVVVIIQKNFSNYYVDSLAPNLIVGFIGSIITVFVIDKILSIERNETQAKYELIANKKILAEAKIILDLLVNIVKASAPKDSKDVPSSYREVFKNSYISEIKYFDFSKDSPVVPRRNWFVHCHHVLTKSTEKLTSVLDTYLPFMDPLTVEAVSALENDSLIIYLRTINAVPQVDIEEGFVRPYTMLNGMENLLVPLAENLISIIEKLEITAKSKQVFDIKRWQPDIAPTIGSGRIDYKK